MCMPEQSAHFAKKQQTPVHVTATIELKQRVETLQGIVYNGSVIWYNIS